MRMVDRVLHMRPSYRYVGFVCVGVLVVLAFVPVPPSLLPKQERVVHTPESLLSKDVSSLPGDFSTYASYFKRLAMEKGAVHAFSVLQGATLAPNTDLHLLGHVVGEELYVEKGIEGMADCTDDFRNACSHTIVVGAFAEHGEAAIADIGDACTRAPGGKGAYGMCFHGLGHGVLAYMEYDLPQAVALCARFGTPAHDRIEYTQCVGGAIMELISGGGHDKELWEKVAPTFFREDDPLYPCTASFMPIKARSQCYQYLTPHLYEAAGADMGHPTPQNFEDAFRFCDAVPLSDKKNRSSCFGGFGKEFVVLAQERDIRKIEDLTSPRLGKVADWCDLANDEQGTLDCDNSAVQSLFWGGENKPDAALRFCNIVPEGKRRDNCFSELTNAVSYYVDDKSYRASLCDEYPELYKDTCQSKLLSGEQSQTAPTRQ